jgi:DNA-binding NtrC family response regulator
MNALNLLIVDDDLLYGRLLKANLDRPGRLRAEVVESGERALDYLAVNPVQAVLTDLTRPGVGGIELVRQIRVTDPLLPVLTMTADGTIERAVEGIRAGATDFLPKPINVTALMALIESAVEERPLREEMAERQALPRGTWFLVVTPHWTPFVSLR